MDDETKLLQFHIYLSSRTTFFSLSFPPLVVVFSFNFKEKKLFTTFFFSHGKCSMGEEKLSKNNEIILMVFTVVHIADSFHYLEGG